MTNKQLCYVSWLPLSEADKSSIQVVQAYSYSMVTMATYCDDEWRAADDYLVGRPLGDDAEFLCIEPVRSASSFMDWLDEIEGFCARKYRLRMDITDSEAYLSALHWVNDAFVAGYAAAKNEAETDVTGPDKTNDDEGVASLVKGLNEAAIRGYTEDCEVLIYPYYQPYPYD